MTTFLDLPLLIREQIYRHVLVMTRFFVRPFISMDYLFDANRVQNYGIPTLALLSVCKQIYQEATPSTSAKTPSLSRTSISSHMKSGMGMESTPSASASTAVLHDRHVENMKEYLWGRTLTFVRKTFRLATLQVDLRHCTCIEGCCRLADEVLRWGWFHVWVNGVPAQVLVRGASPDEKELIVKIFDRQRFHAGVRREEVYDEGRVLDGRDLDGYANVMREVFDKVQGGDGL